jgi:hypothetical protein
MGDQFGEYIDKKLDKIVKGKAHIKDKKPKKAKYVSVVNSEYIKLANEKIKQQTDKYLISVGALRRTFTDESIPDCLEYLTTSSMKIVALSLGLPGAIKISDTCKKIEYDHHDNLKIIIRYVPQASYFGSLYWYTNTKEYNKNMNKLLKQHDYKLTTEGLVNTKTDKYVECSSETQIIGELSKILGINISTKVTDRSDEYIEIVKSKYKQIHKDEISKTTKSKRSTSTNTTKSTRTKSRTKIGTKVESESETDD